MTTPRSRAGFTLIECLVAMAVGALLLSLAIATLQNVLALERAGTRHQQRQEALERLAEQFRADAWSAATVAEKAGHTTTLHLRRAGDETIAYTIDQGIVERTLLRSDQQVSQEHYALPGAGILRFEIAADGAPERISLLCADRRPEVVADQNPFKKPLRITASLGRGQRYLAREAK